MANHPENQSIEILRERLRRFNSDPGQTARRFFGLDFMFAIFFLVIAFSFFWPRIFQTPEQYVSERALNEVYQGFRELQTIWIEGQLAHRSTEEIDAEIQKKLDFYNNMNPMRIFWIKNDLLIPDPLNKPEGWDSLRKKIQNEKRGWYVQTQKGKATLIFFETIPEIERTLVLINDFPPLFKSR